MSDPSIHAKRLDSSGTLCLSTSLPRLDNIHVGTLHQANPVFMRRLCHKSMQDSSVGPRFHAQHVEPFMHWGCSRIRLNEQAFPATVEANMKKQVTYTYEPGSSLSHPQSRQGSRSGSAISRRRPTSEGSQPVIAPWVTRFRDPESYFLGRDAEPDGPWSPKHSESRPKSQNQKSISTMTPASSAMALTSSSFFAACSKMEQNPASSAMALTTSSFGERTASTPAQAPETSSADLPWMRLFMTGFQEVEDEARIVDQESGKKSPSRKAAERAAATLAAAEAAENAFSTQIVERRGSKSSMKLKGVVRGVMMMHAASKSVDNDREKEDGPNLSWAKRWHQGQAAKEGTKPSGMCAQGSPPFGW